MKHRSFAIALLLLLAASIAAAQKGPLDELGFNPEKLYDFSGVDSVNLFNGNLAISVPLGIRYSVSPALSYQFTLVYNSKVWDTETWQCVTDMGPCPPVTRPNLRSNAGLGWRVSLGRLLPPYHGTVVSSLDRNGWMYEGPAGDEHFFFGGSPSNPVQTNVAAGLRMKTVDDNTRDVEFASGQIHRFQYLGNEWRLTQMRDRYNNYVNIGYVLDGSSETEWNVADSVGRHHKIDFRYWSSMNDGWSRGMMIQDAYLEAFGGDDANQAHYHFAYQPISYYGPCSNNGMDSVPLLIGLNQPDGSVYSFGYALPGGSCTNGTLARITYPTGGTANYAYLTQFYPNPDNLCGGLNDFSAVSTKSLDDGSGPHSWAYVYNLGPYVAAAYYKNVGGTTESDTNPCGQPGDLAPSFPNGPVYWSRTSVLAPTDAASHRTRTDHYFSVAATDTTNGWCTYANDLGIGSKGQYGFTGPIGIPPFTARRGRPDASFAAVTDVASSGVGGGLSTELFANCDSGGDCTNGTLLRRTYDTYDDPRYDGSETKANAQTVVVARTEFNDDPACGASPCYTTTTKTDDNGFHQYRTSTVETNFPTLATATATVQYPTWSSSDLVDPTKLWVSERYAERTRTEGTATAHETFCFDNNTTGSLLRHRVLAGSKPGQHDLLEVHSYDSLGDVVFTSDYGGDDQTLDTGSDVCSIPLPSQPSYQVENGYMTVENGTNVYTGGIVTTSRFRDPSAGSALSFFTRDRTIDRYSGAVTTSRDSAGVATLLTYDAKPARLQSVTTPGGAVTTYTYTNAIGSAGNNAFTRARVDASTTSATGTLGKQWVFDGLGRVFRAASSGPNFWSASETAYDAEGRVASKSEPESTGSGPPSGSLIAANKTIYAYDALGRPTAITAPDNSDTTFNYAGASTKMRTAKIWTGSDQPVNVVEEYDGFGRLRGVTEPSGPTTSTSVTGNSVLTSYTYDVGNRLTGVAMGSVSGTGASRTFFGPVQTRVFDYDGRGFLRWESQPESGMVSYAYDARGHVISKTQSAANSAFDMNYTYDSAERLLRIDGRNPFYDPANPAQPQFRAIKEFTYADTNGTFVRNQATLTDLKAGKLVSATRHNYGKTTAEATYDVQDVYHYGDVAGRKTDRTTTISRSQSGLSNVVQAITTSIGYNDLDLPSVITYPMCDGCGTPPTDPDRSNTSRTYTSGRLTTLSNFASSISYWPNGMRNVLSHTNGIDDTQTIANLARPSEITFGTTARPYDRCIRPAFTTQPASVPVSGGSATLTASVSGTGPFTYQWYVYGQSDPIATHGNVSATTDSITVNPTATSLYNVTVSNPCGYEASQTSKVTVNDCPLPTTGTIQAIAQPDGTWILTPNPVARQPRTYAWRRVSDNQVVGSSETLPVGILSTTTSYSLTINDACGTSAVGQVTISVPIPITNGMIATASVTPLQIAVTWPSSVGTAPYAVERRSLGGSWEQAGTTNTTSFVDTQISSGRTYVYRVTATSGGTTNYDVATTTTFIQAVSGTSVTSAPISSMLAAVNSVRAAAGWPSVTWSNILASADPLPDPGQRVTARHVMACRERMNEALQALGVSVQPYTHPDLLNLVLSASYVNEVEQRAQ